MAQTFTTPWPGSSSGNWLPNGPMSLKRAKELLDWKDKKPMTAWSSAGYQPKNTIKMQLTEEEMDFLTKKLFTQLKAVVRETGEDLIKQSIINDYHFKKDNETLIWQTEIDADEKFKIKFELVCQVGDIIKTVSLKKKKVAKRKRFLFQ